ncbi:MAG: hypothetical protein KJ944_17160 [Alphaproteobacteria bacterium]|nr:hypothetical protein [Alphaproteobacteria bacterium]MBU1561933.1 hypothetical protein [Alphaproteobacteria bacterium]MBU2304321.1 hypothetical protein [Alphaproteobacteria bacterium]MBU2369910.1 hypothetical protein [Alphaproteobacteria bacterium]
MRRIFAIGTAALMASALAGSPALAQVGYGFGPGYGTTPGYGFGPGMMTGPGYGQGMMGQPGRGRYTMLDVNEDGVISAEEAASAADEVFTAMDADDDGFVTMEEYMTVRMGPQTGHNPNRQAAMQQAKEDRFAGMDPLAVDRKVEERSVHSALAVQKEADRPYLADL